MKQMKYLYLTLILFMFSCSSSLKDEFDCGGDVAYKDVAVEQDFRKNFKIKFPKKWKVEFITDELKSAIRYIDKTKPLSETTVVEATFMKIHSRVNKKFAKTISADIQKMKLTELKSKLTKYDDNPTYYNLSEGVIGKYKITVFNVFIETDNGLLQVEAQLYGNERINERICKVINAISTVEYIE